MIARGTRKKFGSHFYYYHDGVDTKSLAEKESRDLMYRGFGVHIEHVPEDRRFPWKLWVRELKK